MDTAIPHALSSVELCGNNGVRSIGLRAVCGLADPDTSGAASVIWQRRAQPISHRYVRVKPHTMSNTLGKVAAI